MKTCIWCKEEKPFEAFHKDARRSDGHHRVCKTCKREYDQRYHTENRESRVEHMRNAALVKRFGLTTRDYEEMLAAQGGTCAICPATEGYGGKRLSVDHDHKTGAVRALLCDRCNQLIGKAEDQTELLAKCIEYLLRYST